MRFFLVWRLLGHDELLVKGELDVGKLREIQDHQEIVNIRVEHFLENFGVGARNRVEEVSQ